MYLHVPTVQSILDTEQAIETARKANDLIAAAIERHPTRYAGLAALLGSQGAKPTPQLHAVTHRDISCLRRRASAIHHLAVANNQIVHSFIPGLVEGLTD